MRLTDHRIHAVREIRRDTGWGLRETLIFMADAFGFPSVGEDRLDSTFVPSLNGWRKFTEWKNNRHEVMDFTFEAVQSPHAIAIFKAIAARHAPTGRS